jgi:hypothetical protein
MVYELQTPTTWLAMEYHSITASQRRIAVARAKGNPTKRTGKGTTDS